MRSMTPGWRLISSSFALCTLLVSACSETPDDAATDGGCVGALCVGPLSDSGTPGLGIDSGLSIPGVDAGPVASSGLPCAVKKIVENKCQMCHSQPTNFGALMPLTTQAQFQTAAITDPSQKNYQLSKVRINGGLGKSTMPPPTSPQLDATEKATLEAWFDQGAPLSQEVCTVPPSVVGDAGVGADAGTDGGIATAANLDCYKFVAHANGNKNGKYKVGVANDTYLNFTFAAPWEGTAYGIVLTPIVDNMNVIHHWLLFQDAVPGVDGAVVGSSGAHPAGELVNGWAPGGQPLDFRKWGDVGYEMPGGTYTMEFHYNSRDAAAEDASGIEICVAKTKPKNIAGISWLGWDQFGIPAAQWTGTCAPNAREPIHLLSVMPHMHVAGTHMKAVINGANGAKRTLHDAKFDFNYQIGYETQEVLMPGETVTTTCTYSQPKSFGQATTAEMCYLFTVSYPRGLLADRGISGNLAHGAGACLGQ